MARRVDQVELVALPVDADGLGLDRDPALALELHRVEHLLAHLAARDGVGELEDAVGQRRLPMVDVRDDREVADAVLLHGAHRRRPERARNDSNALELTNSQQTAGKQVGHAARDERAVERDELGRRTTRRAPRRAPTRRRTRRPRATAEATRDAERSSAPSRAELDPPEPAAQEHEQRGRSGDVRDRDRERDPPDADAVEDREERGVEDEVAERDPGRHPRAPGG